jgi:hypothetical protein
MTHQHMHKHVVTPLFNNHNNKYYYYYYRLYYNQMYNRQIMYIFKNFLPVLKITGFLC